MQIENLTIGQGDKLVHASGLNASKDVYRTHYCAAHDDQDMLLFVNLGLMSGPHLPSFTPSGHALFQLTAEGIEAAKRIARKPKAKVIQ